MVRETNDFEDADFWKNYINVIVLVDTVWLSLQVQFYGTVFPAGMRWLSRWRRFRFLVHWRCTLCLLAIAQVAFIRSLFVWETLGRERSRAITEWTFWNIANFLIVRGRWKWRTGKRRTGKCRTGFWRIISQEQRHWCVAQCNTASLALTTLAICKCLLLLPLCEHGDLSATGSGCPFCRTPYRWLCTCTSETLRTNAFAWNVHRDF